MSFSSLALRFSCLSAPARLGFSPRRVTIRKEPETENAEAEESRGLGLDYRSQRLADCGRLSASSSWFRQRPGLSRWLATAVLAWVWVTVGEQILGTFGWIARVPLLGWIVFGLAISLAGRFMRPAPVLPDAEHSPSSRWDTSAHLALGLTLWPVLVIGVPSVMLPVKVVSDGPIYHLYFAARWWKSGFLELIPTPFGETAATYFPANGELWFLWLMTGLGGDQVAKVGQFPFLLLGSMACYGLARLLLASASSALIAACWFATCAPLIIFSFEANVDTIVTAGYLVSTYFLVRFSTGSGGLEALVLSGLAAGLALGSKPTSVVFLPPLLALGLATILAKRDGLRVSLLRSACLLASALLPSLYWFGRNTLLTGNPLYPAHVELFGWTIWSGWYPRSAMSQSHYYVSVGNTAFLIDTLLAVFDGRMVPVWLAALGGLWALKKTGSNREDLWVWILSALVVLNLSLYWLVIPYRTQQRFMLPAVGLAAIPVAQLIDRFSATRWLAVGLLALHLLTPWDWPMIPHLSRYTPMSADLLAMPDSLSELIERLKQTRLA